MGSCHTFMLSGFCERLGHLAGSSLLVWRVIGMRKVETIMRNIKAMLVEQRWVASAAPVCEFERKLCKIIHHQHVSHAYAREVAG